MPSPPTFVAGAEPPAPKLAPSSSIFVGSVVDALAGGRRVGGGPRRLLLLSFFSCKLGKISIKDSHTKVHQWGSE